MRSGMFGFDDPDPYFLFGGPVGDGTPRALIAFIDVIQRRSALLKSSLSPKKDRSGDLKTIIRKGLYFGFVRMGDFSPVERQAAATGKKATTEPRSVFALLCQGCDYDDFASLPGDVVDYCECRKAEERGEYSLALGHIHEAFSVKPNDLAYANEFFSVRLKLGDTTAIEDEMAFYRSDMDCLVHSGRVYEWLKYLSSVKSYVRLDKTIRAVDQALDALIAGYATNRRYEPDRPEGYAHEKTQFEKKTAYLRKRTTAALEKMNARQK
jgi:hypothetical protein